MYIVHCPKIYWYRGRIHGPHTKYYKDHDACKRHRLPESIVGRRNKPKLVFVKAHYRRLE